MLATLGLLAGACSNEDPSEEEESSAGGSGERSGGKGPSHECFDPVFHADSGTESCRTGSGDVYVHRKAVGTGCNYVPPESRGQGGAAGDEDSECFEDTDCSGRYPYCDQDAFGGSRLESCRLRDVLELVIIEGCVGETIAALEAAEAASHALDPAVCEVMSQIVDDERRHAELAYRFVAWALEQQPELAPLAQRAFSEAARTRRGTLPVPTAAPSPGLLGHGLLSTRQRHEVTRLALRDVIEPCARALLSRAPRTAARASLG